MYERLLKENEADPAELVISGMSTRQKLIARKVANNIADTVVIFPPERDTAEGGKHEGEVSEILEKPISRQDQVGLDIDPKEDTDCIETRPIAHGRKTVRSSHRCDDRFVWLSINSDWAVIPTVEAPGYKLQSISCSTLVQFYDNTVSLVASKLSCRTS